MRLSSIGKRYRVSLPVAGITLIVVAVSVSGLASDKGQDDRAASTALPETPALTPTTEPSADLPNAVFLRWHEWSSAAGAWNADLLLGGVGEPVPSYRLGYGATHLVSPDGRIVASADRRSGELTLFDLETWEPELLVQTAPELFVTSWSDDGSQVYGWREYCSLPADRGVCLGPWERDLWRIDRDRRAAERVLAFEFSLMELLIAGERDAARAFARGINTDICCAIDPEGDPFVAVMDLARGELTRKIPLPGLLAGQIGRRQDNPSGASYYPAMILAPDHSRLYVVDPAEDAMTIVDLTTLRVERTVELKEQRSALSRIGDWLRSQVVSTAEAKGGPSYRRMAEITPDGRYLVLSGTAATEVASEDDSTSLENRPAGLMVVDTKNMRIVMREPDIAWFKLSPDGRWILGYGSYVDEDLADENGHGGLVALGLKVIDLTSLKVSKHLWPGQDARPSIFSTDSLYAYVTTEGSGMAPARRSGVGCNVDCFQLALLDLVRGEILWERALPDGHDVLAPPPAR